MYIIFARVIIDQTFIETIVKTDVTEGFVSSNNNRFEVNHEGQFRENNCRTINRGKACTSRKYAQGRDT